jgi:hypothetical protein
MDYNQNLWHQEYIFKMLVFDAQGNGEDTCALCDKAFFID